jgi:hypothetical protein
MYLCSKRAEKLLQSSESHFQKGFAGYLKTSNFLKLFGARSAELGIQGSG